MRRKIFYTFLILCALTTTSNVYASWSVGLEGHSYILLNTSAKKQFDNPSYGGSAFVFFAPELFWDFVAFGVRQSFTSIDAQATSLASSTNSYDTMLGARLAFLDEPWEDWSMDLNIELGANYLDPQAAGGSSEINFTYAIGTHLRYFAWEETSIGVFLRFHQVFGDFTVATNTNINGLNSIEAGLVFEFLL